MVLSKPTKKNGQFDLSNLHGLLLLQACKAFVQNLNWTQKSGINLLFSLAMNIQCTSMFPTLAQDNTDNAVNENDAS